METDWSVAAGAEDPVIETGWTDVTSGTGWLDLRVDREIQQQRIARLPEAASSSALAHVLSLLNAPQGLLMTAKCDRWVLSDDERAELADALDVPLSPCGCGSYIDVLLVHPVPMADFLLHEEWARTTARQCAALEDDDTRLDLVVRPAHRDDGWGYGLSVYHYAAGDDTERAEAAWNMAVERTIPLLIAAAEAMMVPVDEVGGP